MAFVEIRTQDRFHKLVGELDPDRLLLRIVVNNQTFLADLLDYIENPERYQRYGGQIPAVVAAVETVGRKNGRRT